MNQEFRDALAPYIMEGGEFEPYGLSQIQTWPEINYDDGEHAEMEPLDCENFGFVGYTETTLTVSCGGDWQEPHTVVITLVEGQLVVESCEPGDFVDDVEVERDVKQMFEGIVAGPPPRRETIADLEWQMQRAIETENYEEAARLRDRINAMRNG